MFKTDTGHALSLPQMLDEMDIALAAEIKAQESGEKSHKATDGKLVGEQPGLYLYSFSLEEPWEADDDTPISIEASDGQSINGTVVASNGITITISSDKLLSHDVLQKIRLMDGFTQSLKQLREVLKNIPEHNAKIGSKSLGLEPGTSKLSHLTPVPNAITPNDSQRQAIQMSLGSEITYIIGPPGTGKTVTLASIAFNYLLAGQTVLIAAHTNIAVDNAIIQLADTCKNSGASNYLQHGRVVRFGASQHADLQKPEYAEISLSAIAKQQEGQIHTQKEQLQQRLKDIEGQLTNLNQKYDLHVTNAQAALEKLSSQYTIYNNHLVTLVNYQHSYSVIEKELIDLIKQRSSLQNAYAHLNAEHQRMTIELTESQGMHALQRFLKRKRSPDTLAKLLLGLEQDSFSINQQLQEIEKYLQESNKRFDAVKSKITYFISSELAELPPFTTVSKDIAVQLPVIIHTLQEIVQNIVNQTKQSEYQYNQLQFAKGQEQQNYLKERELINNELENIGIQLKGIEKNIVAKAQIVATTLTKTYMNADLSKRIFDVVIIDEASMAPLPAVYFAASRANQSAVILGDPQQLPPICIAKDSRNPRQISESEKSLALKWLGRDIFTLRGITLEMANNGQENCALLKEQSRMHPTISAIAKKYVYNNLIIDASERIPREELAQIQPAPNKHLVLCDTSDVSPIAVRPTSGSRINIYHAFCAIAIIRQVLSSLPNDTDKKDKQRIGVVTPYNKQAKLLQNLIKDAGIEKWVRAGTVHKFQGLEFDVVIFDTVDSCGVPTIDFTAGPHGTEAMRLVNVAVTRAKHKLIIIANRNHIQNVCERKNILHSGTFKEDSILLKAIEEARRAGPINSLDITNLPQQLPDNPLFRNSSFYSEVLKNFEQLEYEHLNEHTFHDRLIEDTKAARKQILLFSPFLSLQRASITKPYLIQKCRAGVEVIIATSDIKNEPSYGSIIADLKQYGIKHQKLSGEHEKFAFFDNAIAYIGSLNSLSYGGTIEYMLRIKSSAFVEGLWKFVNAESVVKAPAKRGESISILYSELPNHLVCKKCGRALVVRYGSYGAFYGCTSYRKNSSTSCDYTEEISEEHLKDIEKLKQKPCKLCNGPTELLVRRKNAWLICAAANPCNYGYPIVYIDDKPEKREKFPL